MPMAAPSSPSESHPRDALITPHAVRLSQTAPRCPPSEYHTDPSLRRMTRTTRSISRVLPLSVQNGLRDAGAFRWIADALVTSLAVPMGALACPSAVATFWRLTKTRRKLVYGTDDDSQFVDVFFPNEIEQPSNKDDQTSKTNSATTGGGGLRGMVVFVHGGAWGSGKPWFYRLLAIPFLELGLAVAIVGYRVYPVCGVPGQGERQNDSVDSGVNSSDSNSRGGVLTQVDDLEAALGVLARTYPEWCDKDFADRWVSDRIDNGGGDDRNPNKTTKYAHHLPHVGTIVMGHSSGAHIALLWILERAQHEIAESSGGRTGNDAATTTASANTTATTTTATTKTLPRIDAFVGLSGVYNIDHHFDYESGRSVQEISPLKPANGHDRTQFLRHSPPWKIQHELLLRSKACEDLADWNSFPQRLLFVHGAEDDVVPLPATGETAKILRHVLAGTASASATATASAATHVEVGNVCIDEVYIPRTGHQDTVVDLMMLGGHKGPVTSAVIEWLRTGNRHLHERKQTQEEKQRRQQQQPTRARLRSKL